MGMVPYYMFVERDTGPQGYFAVPLARAAEIFRDAYSSVSGLCRTVRGPSMSATPGKVCIDGVTEIAGEQVFALHMIQARDPALVGQAVLRALRPGRRLAVGPAGRHSPTGSRSTRIRPTAVASWQRELLAPVELAEISTSEGPGPPRSGTLGPSGAGSRARALS